MNLPRACKEISPRRRRRRTSKNRVKPHRAPSFAPARVSSPFVTRRFANASSSSSSNFVRSTLGAQEHVKCIHQLWAFPPSSLIWISYTFVIRVARDSCRVTPFFSKFFSGLYFEEKWDFQVTRDFSVQLDFRAKFDANVMRFLCVCVCTRREREGGRLVLFLKVNILSDDSGEYFSRCCSRNTFCKLKISLSRMLNAQSNRQLQCKRNSFV